MSDSLTGQDAGRRAIELVDDWIIQNSVDITQRAMADLGDRVSTAVVEAVKDSAETFGRELAKAAIKAEEELAGLQHTLALWEQECGGIGPRAFVEQARREERQAWIEYHEWVLRQCVGPLSLAIAHGWRETDEVVAEGYRRRELLGYTAPTNE